jgi:uncharacterized OB-fold protein
MEIDQGLIKFYENKKNDLIPIYKNSVAVWNNWIEDIDKKTRKIPNIHLVRVKIENDNDIIVIKINVDSSKIIVGHPVAYYLDSSDESDESNQKNTSLFKSHSVINLDGYTCNNCGDKLITDSSHCEMCDFDLCPKLECSSIEHDHPMFKNNKYFGMNTYDLDSVVSEYIANIM